MKRAWLWLALAAAAAWWFLQGTEAGAVVLQRYFGPDSEADAIRRAARKFAAAYGIDPEIVEAIGWVESRWKLRSVNMAGSDGARGGAWGPFQLTEATARAWGYTGPMVAFTENPDLAAEWCARGLAARPGGPPTTLELAAAWWNAGRTSTANLPASTRDSYIPALQRALVAMADLPLGPDGYA